MRPCVFQCSGQCIFVVQKLYAATLEKNRIDSTSILGFLQNGAMRCWKCYGGGVATMPNSGFTLSPTVVISSDRLANYSVNLENFQRKINLFDYLSL